MGCKPSSQVPPSPTVVTTAPFDSPTKRKRAETPPLSSSSSETLANFPLSPESPQKKTRPSPSDNRLSAKSSSTDVTMPPEAPLTPPSGLPALSGINNTALARNSPLTPPVTLGRAGGLDSSYDRSAAPPSPTPVRRNEDVDALSMTLGSFTLTDSATDSAADAPEVVESTQPISRVPVGGYRMDFGPYQGYAVHQLPKEYRKQISDDDEIIKRAIGLREALTEWASRWSFGYGRHAGKKLADVPLFYLNEFVFRISKHRDPGQEDLYAALKFHFLVREKEEPGSKYVMTFGKHRDQSLDQLPGRSYINWMKGRGIPCQSGYEDLAEAIEYLHRRDLADFIRTHPSASTYTMPEDFGNLAGKPLSEFTEAALRIITDGGLHKQLGVNGIYLYPGMKDAVELWWLVFDTNRWNWRRERNAVTGEIWCYPPDLGSNLLFPRSDVKEVAYTGY